MLTIDRVRDVLMEDPEIMGAFAEHKGAPAIWMKDQAPFDTSEFWSQDRQYPRADLTITTQYLPERQVQGQFAVNLIALNSEVDAMIKRIISVLDGALLLSDEGRDNLQWAGTPDGDVEDDIAHFMIMFNLVRVTDARTFEPDPIVVLNRWSNEKFPEAMVNPESWLPLRDTRPAIYWRSLGETATRHYPNDTEFQGSFVAHVIHPDPIVRANMVRRIVVEASTGRGMRIGFADLKPHLRLDENGIAYDSNRDPLRVGQVRLSPVMYFIHRPEISVPKLENIVYDITAS